MKGKVALAMLTAALLLLVMASVAFAQFIQGTSGPNNLQGTQSHDLIRAHGGADVVRGLGGADTVLGGPGNDRLYGGAGGDVLRAARGNDKLYGGDRESKPPDEYFCGPGTDTAYVVGNEESPENLRGCENVVRVGGGGGGDDD